MKLLGLCLLATMSAVNFTLLFLLLMGLFRRRTGIHH